MVVVLPAPLGPRKPKISPAPDGEPDAAHRLDVVVALLEVDDFDRGGHETGRKRRRRSGAAATGAAGAPRRGRARRRTRSCRGASAQAGSVAAASPSSAKAWQRQPPKSVVALVAGAAGRGHPVLAAEGAEAGAVVPDVGERAVADVLPGGRERRDLAGLVAGQRDAVGGDDQVAARPPVHAGARAIGVVVGAHEEDLHLAAQPLARRERDPRAPRRPPRATASSASRLASAQPRYCVLASSRRAAPSRSASATNSGDARDVPAVEHDVERERQPQRARRGRRRQLGRPCRRARRSRPRPADRCPAPRAAGCRARRPPAAPRRSASAGMPLVMRLM